MQNWFLILISAFCVQALATEKPVSMSYKSVIQCFPVLKDPSNSAKIDLSLLRETIDDHFITSSSVLLLREVHFKSDDGQEQRLKLQLKDPRFVPHQYTLSLQNIDDKGVLTDVKLPDAQRVNPKQEVINELLYGKNVISDDFTYLDTKLNNITMKVRRHFKELEELDLLDPRGNHHLFCEKQKDLGIICTCSKK